MELKELQGFLKILKIKLWLIDIMKEKILCNYIYTIINIY
jgi:hypothetical protein